MNLEFLQWLNDRLSALGSDIEGRKDVLLEMKSKLSYQSSTGLNFQAGVLNLTPCFACLDSNELSEDAADVLAAILENIQPDQVFVNYRNEICVGLSNNISNVKRAFLKLILKLTSGHNELLFYQNNLDLLEKIIECLACPDRNVAEGSVQIFKQVGNSVPLLSVLFSEQLVAVLKRLMQIDDITRFRIYEIIVDVVVKQDQALEMADNSTILPALIAELKSSDTLIKLNVLELMTVLTGHQRGLLYLQRHGVIKFLLDEISNSTTDPLSFILLPGVIEFFGNLFKRQPQVFAQQYPEVLQLLFDSFNTVDPALLGVLIATIGKIGSSDEGKRVLLAYDGGTLSFFRKMEEVLERKNALCVTALSTISALMLTEDEELSYVCERWFTALGPNAILTLFNIIKLPFVDVRLGGLQLLETICKFSWGCELVGQVAGLVEFLLDRDAEFDKDCRITKYDVIKQLTSHSPSSISHELLSKLHQHVTEGPYFISQEPQTAVEEG